MEQTVKKKAIGLICLLAVVCLLVALIAFASAFGAEDKPTAAAAETGFPVPNCAPTDGGAKHDEIFGADSYANHSHDNATALTLEYLDSCNHTPPEGTYYLTSNLKYDGVIVRIISNRMITICLNGFMLESTGDGAPVYLDRGMVRIVDHKWDENSGKDHHYTVDETGKYVFSETQAAVDGGRYIRGGVIMGGSASGGAIIRNPESWGYVYMYGGTVAGNSSPYGAIYASSVVMAGGMVAGNVIDAASDAYSAVTITANGGLTMTNGIITDNVGGGVRAEGENQIQTTISGTPIVTGNRLKDGTPRNIYINAKTTLSIETMTETSTKTGLYVANAGLLSFDFAQYNPGKNPMDFFESDNPNIDFFSTKLSKTKLPICMHARRITSG